MKQRGTGRRKKRSSNGSSKMREKKKNLLQPRDAFRSFRQDPNFPAEQCGAHEKTNIDAILTHAMFSEEYFQSI